VQQAHDKFHASGMYSAFGKSLCT